MKRKINIKAPGEARDKRLDRLFYKGCLILCDKLKSLRAGVVDEVADEHDKSMQRIAKTFDKHLDPINEKLGAIQEKVDKLREKSKK